MNVFRESTISEPVSCPYLPEREFIEEYFFDISISRQEFSQLLAQGWRKFGCYFFRPACDSCRECIPVRIMPENFAPSKSQRRVIAKNRNTEITVTESCYTEERFQLFKKFSEMRFNHRTRKDEYLLNFCISPVSSFVMEYRAGNALVGTGYIDYASDALNSVYFAFDPDYHYLSPGIYSLITEIRYAGRLGLKYYYPGYYVKGNSSMEYKLRFTPSQVYDWEGNVWKNHL